MCEKSVKIGHFSHVFHMVFHIHTPSSVLRGLFLEVLIHGRVYLQREICVLKSTGLAL